MEFEDKLSVLKQLRDIWAAGGKVEVQQVDCRKNEKGTERIMYKHINNVSQQRQA